MLEALVVEDDPRVASLVVRLLQRRGITATVVASRADALAAVGARAGAFAVAYVDLGLPDGSGADVVNELGRVGSGTPVIAATGAIGDVDVEATVVLRKPFLLPAFDEAVDVCLGGRG